MTFLAYLLMAVAAIWIPYGSMTYLIWARQRYDRMITDFPSIAVYSFWDISVVFTMVWMGLMGPFVPGYLRNQDQYDTGR